MRIRSTKPEFYRSKTIAKLDWADRHVLKALESYVDDNGVGKNDVALFAADAFPRDMFGSPPETFRRLSRALDRFSELGLIVQYEAQGEELVYIDRWAERQRIDKPSRGRFPRPDGTFEYAEEVDRSVYRRAPEEFRSTPESLAPGTGEQGNRGTDLSCSSADAEEPDGSPDRFDEFWDAYGKKVGRKKAEQKFKLATKKTDPDRIIAAAESYVRSQVAKGKHPEFTKDPATWLNGEHWNDEATATVHPIRPGSPADPDAWMRPGWGLS